MIAIRNDILSSEQKELTTECEIIWRNIQISGHKDIYVGSYYRPHYKDMKSLLELRNSLSLIAPNANKILAGDFNLPYINWDTNTTKPHDKREYSDSVETSDKFLEINRNFNFDQMVYFPTGTKNILDRFLTTNKSLINGIKPAPGMSDHDMVVIDFDITTQIPKNKPRKVYKFAKTNYEVLKMDITQFKEEYFGSDLNNRTVEENRNKFKKNIYKAMAKLIPIKYFTSRTNLPWHTTSIK